MYPSKPIWQAWVSERGRILTEHSPHFFDDPKDWGYVLADICQAIRNAQRKLGKPDPIPGILELFNSELKEPTTEYGGGTETVQ
jgi:hypothetical protein